MGSCSSKSDRCPLGHLITTFHGHSDGINSMALSDNGYILVTAGDDKTGKVWEAKDGEGFRKLGELIGHNGYISCILIVGDYILTGSSDKTVRKWDVENEFKCIVQCNGHSSLIHRMICNGDFIFTSSFDHTARCFDFENGLCLRVFKGHKRAVYPLLFIPTDFGLETTDADVDLSIGLLVTGSADGMARTWNCDTGQKINVFKQHRGAVICLATDETNVNLLTGSTDNTIIMWNIATANALKVCIGHENSLICMQSGAAIFRKQSATSSNGKLWSFVFSAHDPIAALLPVHQHLFTFMDSETTVVAVGITIVGDKLYSGSSDGTVREWVYKYGECSMVMRNHTRTVTSIKVVTKIEPDANDEKMLNKRYVFTGCGDRMVRCFDPSTGRLIRLFPGHTNSITSIKVHKDRLYSASYDGTVKLWYAFDEGQNNNNIVPRSSKS